MGLIIKNIGIGLAMLLFFTPVVTLASDSIDHRTSTVPPPRHAVDDQKSTVKVRRTTREVPRRTNVVDHRKPRTAPPPRHASKSTVHDHRKPAAYPTFSPPPPRYENPASKSGYVWKQGYYEWKDGAYVWKSGYWTRARDNKVWVPGSWAAQGERWVYTRGHYETARSTTSKVKGKGVRRSRAPKGTGHRVTRKN
jgi:hypothetical protein